MSEIHDEYYGIKTDPVALAKELDKYIAHIKDCMHEECTYGLFIDLKLQLDAAEKVRENIRRVFDE